MRERQEPPTIVQRLTGVRPEEAPTLAWSLLYIGSLFLAYYVLRPIRDELGVAGGVSNLPWLFTGALLAMLLLNPLFGYVVRHFTRERVISISYRFFTATLVVITLLLATSGEGQQMWVGRALFIWVSVFNLFVVSVFWSFIQDIFDTGQGRRLFGILAAGATLGGLLGSALTTMLVEHVGRTWLIAACVILIEMAVLASRKLSHASASLRNEGQNDDAEEPIGGGVFAGMIQVFRSPYLFGLACFILIYSITSTFLYFQQASYAEANFPTREAKTAFFANIDLWVHSITLFVQIFLTGRLMAGLGVLVTLCALPLVSAVGFAALTANPTVGVFVVAQVARRVTNFALARPAREVLFTSSTRDDRYKAKNFIDTVVYRGGDQVGSWSYAGLMAIGLCIGQIAVVGVPLSLAWLCLGFWLGRTHNQQKIAQANSAPA